MFADFFSPTTVGVCLVALAILVYTLFKLIDFINSEIQDLKLQVFSLERRTQDLECSNENLWKRVSLFQNQRLEILTRYNPIKVRVDEASKEIQLESDKTLSEWSDDDFQDEDDETNEWHNNVFIKY